MVSGTLITSFKIQNLHICVWYRIFTILMPVNFLLVFVQCSHIVSYLKNPVSTTTMSSILMPHIPMYISFGCRLTFV